MYQPIELTITIPAVRTSFSRSPSCRRVLFVTVPAAALVALTVVLGPVAHAGTTPTPTPTPTSFNLRKIPLQSNAWGAVNVNQALNKIYTSGNPCSNSDIEVVVIDGKTFTSTPVGYGQEVSVDNKSNRYWAATIFGNGTYPPGVIVRDGKTNTVITPVALNDYCPIATAYDFFKNRMWVGAQCGGDNDPVFAIDANTFQVIAGPIGSGHVMGSIIANGANGRLYLQVTEPTAQYSERVDPKTFAVTQNAFGQVVAINAITNRLYAVSGNNLQIINGAPDPEVILATIPLGYAPGGMGINTGFNHLYIANPAGNSVEVRNASTGALITTFSLGLGVTPNGAMAVDSIRGRIYVIQNPSSCSTPAPVLLVIEDLINAFKPDCILSH